MANTTNLNLVKPAGTDYALVSVINGNMDIIDSKVGAIPANESAQSQITALNDHIANLQNGEDISSQITLESGCSLSFARKFGKRILLIGTTSKIITANTSQLVGTIASGYRPSNSVPGSLVHATSSDFGYGTVAAYPSGNIEVTFSKATTYGLAFEVEYMIP